MPSVVRCASKKITEPVSEFCSWSITFTPSFIRLYRFHAVSLFDQLDNFITASSSSMSRDWLTTIQGINSAPGAVPGGSGAIDTKKVSFFVHETNTTCNKWSHLHLDIPVPYCLRKEVYIKTQDHNSPSTREDSQPHPVGMVL